MSAALMAMSLGAAYANPQDGVVSSGSASITSSGSTLNIHQSTERAVIDWRSFDIGVGETTRFYQPSASSITLNRVNSSAPSFIDGNLIANGNIFIVNQNGVLFGQNSRVDVNGLVASTADIDNANFMAGDFRFDRAGNATAVIENRGMITAGEAGLVGLVAPNVLNSGVIHAKLGRVQLASGDTATVDLYGDGLMEVAAGDYVDQRVVENTGKITAEGGTIALTASAGATMVNNLVRVSGELKAPSVGVRNGKIIIGAEGSNAVKGNVATNKGKKTGKSTVVVENAVLEASGDSPGERGGTIEITADDIRLLENVMLDVSGYAGGGSVFIGGSSPAAVAGLPYTPVNVSAVPLPVALETFVHQGTVINASATGAGDGGHVVVMSDRKTEFAGTIIADAAGNDGNGGFAETSSHDLLQAYGAIHLRSGRRGRAGTWLLDPADITITTLDTNITGNPNYTATGTGSQVSAASIVANLNAGTNVTILTTNDAHAGNGDIFVNAAITATGSGSLTLSAYRDITVSSAITLNGGSLTLRSDNTGAGTGAINVTVAIATNGGNVTMGGGSGVITAGSGYASGHAGRATGISVSGNITAAGGSIIMNGRGASLSSNGNSGIVISGATVSTTGAGAITLNGTGGGSATSSSNFGVYVTAAAAMSTANGNLTIAGTSGGSSGGDNIGIRGDSTGTIQTSGSGNLSMTGVSNSAAGNGKGLYLSGGGLYRTTGSGSIIVNGTGSALNTGAYNIGLQLASSIAAQGTGSLTVTGTGGGSGASGNNSYGLLLQNGGLSTVNGTLDVTGIGGSGSGAVNSGIYITSVHGSQANMIRSSGSGTVIVRGVKGGGTTAYGIDSNITNSILTTGTGNITLFADTISLAATNAVNAAGILTIAPYSNGTMGVGYATGYTLNLDATALNNINGASYVFGSLTTGTGAASTGDVAINTTKDFAAKNLTFIAGGDVALHGSLTRATGVGASDYIFRAKGNVRNSNLAGVVANAGSINILMQSDYDADGSGAIYLNGGTLSTNGGNVTLGGGSGVISAGVGYAYGNATYNHGVYMGATIAAAGGNVIINGTSVMTTSVTTYGVQTTNAITTTGSGSITINGIARAASGNISNSFGIYLQAGTNTVNGNITLTGTGGGSGTGSDNYGTVFSSSGGYARTTGSGNIIVNGTGGTGSGGVHVGVLINFINAIQSLGTGSINVTGTAGVSAGATNIGVIVGSGAAGSISSAGGAITITGTGGAGTGGAAAGVMVGGVAGSSVTNTGSGSITINGTGGGTIASGSNNGVSVTNGGIVSAVNGAVILNGTGGGAGSGGSNNGVVVGTTGTGALVRTTGTGTVTINGNGGNNAGNAMNNYGILITTGNSVQATGTGGITFNGTGSAASVGSGVGVNILGTVSAAGGAINFTGTGGLSAGNSNDGIRVSAGTVSNTGAGTITFNGTGGGTGSSGSNYGIWIVNAGTVSAVNGAVTFTGTGGSSTGGSNHGIGVTSAGASAIRTTGSGSIILNGGTASASSNGLNLLGVTNGVQTTGTGNISLYANTMSLNTASTVNSVGSLTISALTPGTTMGIGTGTGTFIVTDAQLGYTTAASYILGATNIGNMAVNTAFDFGNRNVTFLSGGNITLAGTLTKATGTGAANYLFRANGNVTNSGGAGIAAPSGSINLTFISDYDVSGSGSVTLTNAGLLTNNGTITITSNGQAVNVSGTIGGATTINSSNGSVTLGSIDGTTAGTKDLIINAGTGTLTTTAGIGVTNRLRDFTINANDVVLGGNVSGSGALTIQNVALSRDIYIARGTADGTNLNISTTELGYFADGWGSINIGNASGSGSLYIGTTSWVDPIYFRNNFRVDMGGTLTATGNASVNFNVGSSGWINQNIITTAGQNVTFSGAGGITGAQNITTSGGAISAVYVMIAAGNGSPVWSTSGGNITISSAISRNSSGGSAAARTFTLNAGSGAVSLGSTVNGDYGLSIIASGLSAAGALGGTEALGDVTLNIVNSISLPAITTAAGRTVNATVTGAGNVITTTGAIATGTGGNITLTADDLVLGGSLSGSGTLILQPSSTSRIVRINSGVADGTNFNLNTAEIGYFADGWSQINIGNTASTVDSYIGPSSWMDPVRFRSNYRKYTYALTGTGNASISVTGGWIDMYGDITTSGTAVDLSGLQTYLYAAGAPRTISTNGGNILLKQVHVSATSSDLVLTSAGGNISIADQITNSGSTAGRSLTFNAGAGTVTFVNTVNTQANIIANGSTITSASAWGSTTNVGNVTLTSVNSISLPAITAQAGRTVTVNVTGAGNSITTTGAIATGAAGNISLTSDDLILGGNLSGTGTLTLQPAAASRPLLVNYGTSNGTNYHLSNTELGYLVNGWSQINIGNTANNVVSYIGVSSWTDPVNFRSSTGRQVLALAGTDNASFTFSGLSSWVDLYGDITTTGGSIDFSGANYTWLASSGASTRSISSLGGNISFRRIYLSQRNLDVNAGAGSVSFSSGVDDARDITVAGSSINIATAWGATSALGNVTLTSVNGLSLPSVRAARITAVTTGTNANLTLASGSALTASGAGSAITLAAAGNFINNSGSATPFVLTGGGRWKTYSANPGSDSLGGITSDFVRYGCTYGGSCPSGVTVPGTGNGTIYTYRPTLTLTPDTVGIIYGNAGPSLSGYAYTVSGYLTGAAGNESTIDNLTGTLAGVTDYLQGADVGSYYINYGSGSVASALGYQIAYANNASAVTVSRRTLNVSLTGSVDKVYDGNNNAAISAGNYALSNFYGSDAATVSVANTAGSYDDKNAGSGKGVTVSGLTLTGAKSGNYQLSTTTVNANVGNISRKALSITGLAGVDRIYDGTTNAGLSGSASLSGDVSGDDIYISATGTGSFADRNAGSNKAILVTGFGVAGADQDNYVLSQPTGLTATISRKALTVTATDQTVTYGTDVPLTSAITYTGFITGEDVSDLTMAPTAASAVTGRQNAGTYNGNYTVSGGVSDNYSFNYVAADLTVARKILAVTAGNLTIVEGAAVPATAPLTYSGFVSGENSSVLDTLPVATSVLSGAQPTGVYAGNYVVAGGADNNYSFNYLSGNLIVTGRVVTVPPVPVLPSTVVYTSQRPALIVTPLSQVIAPTSVTYEISRTAVDGQEANEDGTLPIKHVISAHQGSTAFVIEITPELAEILSLNPDDLQQF